jgi:hypothetical protein
MTDTAVATGPSKAQGIPCPKIHAALLAWSLLPLVMPVNPNVNVVVSASLAVLAGSWRSVKPEAVPMEDRMSKKVRSAGIRTAPVWTKFAPCS